MSRSAQPVYPVLDLLRRRADACPDAVACASAEAQLTYLELLHCADRYGACLAAAGVGPGDVVAVLGRSCLEAWLVFLGCCRTGAIYLGLNPSYTSAELCALLADAKPRILFALYGAGDVAQDAKVAGLAAFTGPTCRVVTRAQGRSGSTPLEQLLAAGGQGPKNDRRGAGPDPPCALVYTSGSTGTPKGAMLSQSGIIRGAELSLEHWYGVRGQLRMLAQYPISHVGWVVSECLAGLVAGGFLVFRERFDAAATLDLIERYRLTVWHAFPAMIVKALETPEFEQANLTSLACVALGASPPAAILTRLRDRTEAVLCASYGLTESSGGALTATHPDAGLDTVAESIGTPVPGVEMRLADRHGRAVQQGEVGELLVRDRCVFLGYRNAPDATASAIDDEGWLHTGDLVRAAPDGNLSLVGRLREMYKSGGYNVYPAEIETALASHDGVRAVAVVGAPDPVWDEVGVAFVSLQEGCAVDASELSEHARQRLANFKVPKRFVLVDELPRLKNDKIDRLTLRSQAARLVASE
jgi:acyl-CoA synthetase (AMP-forming)/AMP-acid ligase II